MLTALGGLIVLGMFLYRWCADLSNTKFFEVAMKLFGRSSPKKGLMPRIRDYLNCWIADGKYSGDQVDAFFRDIFGSTQSMIDWQGHQLSGTKVAVTAASTLDSSCVLLTNYNNELTRPPDMGKQYTEQNRI